MLEIKGWYSGRFLLLDNVLGGQWVLLACLSVLQLGRVEVLNTVEEFVLLLFSLDR